MYMYVFFFCVGLGLLFLSVRFFYEMRGSVCALRNIVEIHRYNIDLHKYIYIKLIIC